MKTKTFSWFKFLFPALLAAVFALGGCLDDGDDGAPGPKGDTGDQGLQGEPGTATLDAQTLFDLGLHEEIVALNPQIDLSNTVAYDAVTGEVTVHFFLTDGTAANKGIDVLEDAYELIFYISELRPNNDGTTGLSWHQVERDQGTPATGEVSGRYGFGNLEQVKAATGEYNYVFENPLPASDNVIRVTARARWREPVDVNGDGEIQTRGADAPDIYVVFANPVNASYDFLQADPGTELASSGADMVSTEACESCHGARIGNVGHGGGYTEVKTCNNCHNVNYMASRNTLEGDLSHVVEGDLAFMIHRIHSAFHEDSGRGISTGTFQKLGDPEDFTGEIRYPQEIYTCSKCHTEEAPDAALHTLVPTRANCGSCHDDVNFATAENHPIGIPYFDDTECKECHHPGKFADATVAHNPDTNPALVKAENIPEYEVTITMTPPDNGTHYVAGETPLVTVTLAGANPVAYTADEDADSDTDGVLHEADLFVYGPRANAVPVLTTNSTTDPAWDPATRPTQGHNLLLTGGVSSDPQVKTDATGYKYQLMDNIGDLQPGTYMVRFEGLDYGTPGAPSVPEYWTASTAVKTFQVGTATEEPKVSGDACTNCHGETAMHVEGGHPHNQPFDTDGCLGCHDLSPKGYADYIGNRAHAVHSASFTGDLNDDRNTGLPRNWSHVTFPRPANNCRTCHTNAAADVPVWRDPNEVACGGCHGTDWEGDPASYPDDPVTQADVSAEIAAANHMLLMGGGDINILFNPETTNPNGLDYVDRQCLVCHGEGRIADTFETHGLVNFPVTDTSTPED